jgi:curved DNA-binding protein CbpA
MNRFHTYYDLFGISPSATPREVRAAYIRLMKRHHPDLRGPAEVSNSDMVATANRYYAILKDPSKRAAYDFTIARAAAGPPTGAGRKIAAPRRARASGLPVLLIAAIAFVAGAAPIAGGDRGRAADAHGVTTAATDGALAGEVPMPTSEQIAQIVRHAISTRADRAVWISQQCYAKARAARSQSAAQICIVFDEAALYSASAWQDNLAGSTYFNPGIVQVRQSGALAPFADVDAERLDQLRTKAFLQLLKETRVEDETAISAPLPTIR